MEPGYFGKKIHEISNTNLFKNVSAGIGYKDSIEKYFNQIEEQPYDVFVGDETYYGGVLEARQAFLNNQANVNPQDQTINGFVVTTKATKGSRDPISFSNPRVSKPVAQADGYGQIGSASTDAELHIMDMIYPGSNNQGPIVVGGTSYKTASSNVAVSSSTDIGSIPPVDPNTPNEGMQILNPFNLQYPGSNNQGASNAVQGPTERPFQGPAQANPPAETYFGSQNQGTAQANPPAETYFGSQNQGMKNQTKVNQTPKSPVGTSTNTGTIRVTNLQSTVFNNIALNSI